MFTSLSVFSLLLLLLLLFGFVRYPFLESAHMFFNVLKEHFTYSNHADIARFTVPGRLGIGNFILWFYWSGYMDCVDINVQPGTTAIVNRYGLPASATNVPTFVKLDHCEYTYIGSALTQARKLGSNRDASACVADCAKTRNCYGVQIVRVAVSDAHLAQRG